MRQHATFDRARKRPGPPMYLPFTHQGRPHFHKTFRGAQARAGTHGKVAVLDFTHLPQVIAEQDVTVDQLSDVELAERQMLAWSAIADRLRRKERLP